MYALRVYEGLVYLGESIIGGVVCFTKNIILAIPIRETVNFLAVIFEVYSHGWIG